MTFLRSPVRVFAVEDRSVQLMWSALPADVHTVGVGDHHATVIASPPAMHHRPTLPPHRLSRLPVGPGAVTIDGLEPATAYDVWVADRRRARRVVGRVTTLSPPPGKLLARFATFSDMHVGERRFGLSRRIEEGPLLGSAAHCLRAAVTEAVAWGAELLVSRGDLTRNSHPQEFALAARILTSTVVPAIGVLGNHDVRHRVDGAAIMADNGMPICTDVAAHDLPGIRLVLGHSPVRTRHDGDLPPARMAGIAELCRTAPGAAAVVMHHPLCSPQLVQPYPPGVPVDQSNALGAALVAANPSTVILAGHRHRNRRRTIAGVTVSEVGSTKDYPGGWAGYAVHEGGIRQVVRRVADPAAIAWTEVTGRAVGGVWQRWSPGTLDDRCWVQAW